MVAPLRLDIDPDVALARTPPSRLYHDPRWFERVRQAVLPRTWHLFPGVVPDEPGSQSPWSFLEEEPLLLVRDDDGRVSCLSNICTHRGNVLVDAPCRAGTIRCRYHGRRFDLAGRMTHAPRFEGVGDFPRTADNLPEVATGSLGPLHFASLDPSVDLGTVLGPVRERVGFMDLSGATVQAAGTQTYEFDGNWALYCDNYLEGFHIPFVHPGLIQALDYGDYTTELLPHGTLQVGVVGPDQPAFDLPEGHPDAAHRVGAYYFFLFPTTMLNFYPWGLSINCVIPLGPTRTRVEFVALATRPELMESGAGAGLHQVEMEDEAVVLGCQRGVRSRLYDRGRYSAAEERGVHHFHRLLASYFDEGA